MKDNGQMLPAGDPWGLEEETEMSVEGIDEFERLIDKAFKLDKEIKEIEKMEIAPRKEELKKLDEGILATLKKHNKTSYRGNAGMVVKTEKFSVKFPKNNDRKEELLNFMGRQTYFDMSSINYQSFNAWCKAKHDEAIETGNMDYSIPGCEQPTFVEYLSRRK